MYNSGTNYKDGQPVMSIDRGTIRPNSLSTIELPTRRDSESKDKPPQNRSPNRRRLLYFSVVGILATVSCAAYTGLRYRAPSRSTYEVNPISYSAWVNNDRWWLAVSFKIEALPLSELPCININAAGSHENTVACVIEMNASRVRDLKMKQVAISESMVVRGGETFEELVPAHQLATQELLHIQQNSLGVQESGHALGGAKLENLQRNDGSDQILATVSIEDMPFSVRLEKPPSIPDSVKGWVAGVVPRESEVDFPVWRKDAPISLGTRPLDTDPVRGALAWELKFDSGIVIKPELVRYIRVDGGLGTLLGGRLLWKPADQKNWVPIGYWHEIQANAVGKSNSSCTTEIGSEARGVSAAKCKKTYLIRKPHSSLFSQDSVDEEGGVVWYKKPIRARNKDSIAVFVCPKDLDRRAILCSLGQCEVVTDSEREEVGLVPLTPCNDEADITKWLLTNRSMQIGSD